MERATRAFYKAIEKQAWLDKAGDPLQRGIAALWDRTGEGGQRVKDVMHGRPLGHPLHPVLTDVPLGFWNSACAFDALSLALPSLRKAADVSIGIGIVGAVGAAATGITDWEHTSGESRRVGIAHALLNTVALVLYTTSFWQRLRGRRAAGMASSILGYAVGNVSASLGGHLVYDRNVGANHAHNLAGPEHWAPVAPEAAVIEGEPYRVDAAGVPVVLVRREGRLYALADRCAHLGGPLAEGKLEDGCIVCPWHGSAFALADGALVRGPSVFPQPALATRVRAGHIEVRRLETESSATPGQASAHEQEAAGTGQRG